MKSALYTTTGDDPLNDWTKKKLQSISQSQICTQKKIMVTVGGLLPIWSTKAFWKAFWKMVSVKPLHLRSMLSKSESHWKLQRLQPALVNWRDPMLLHQHPQPHIAQPTLQKLSELSFAFLPYSPDLLPTDYHFFKHLDNFLQGKCFHNQQEAKNAFQKFVESWSTDFIYFLFLFFIFYIVVDFVIHWNETAMGLHMFPILIPPPTSLSTQSL